MKPRVAALIGLVAVAVIVIGVGGYWYVKVHTRISQASLESQVLAKEVGAFGITVNAVGPTPIATDLIRGVPEGKIKGLLAQQALPRFGEMQDIALNRVRPLFAVLEGVSAPPPFGGNQRTIVVRLNPDKLNSYNISAEEA